MNETFLLYLFTRLDAIHGTMFVLCALCAIGVGGFGIYLSSCYTEDEPWGRKMRDRCFAGAVVFLVLAILTPSQRDVAIIVGSKIAIDVARSPEAAEIGGKVKTLIIKKLDDEINKEKE